MTKNVIDNAILMNALQGEDARDKYSFHSIPVRFNHLDSMRLKGKRLGLYRSFAEDSLMQNAVVKMKNAGANIIVFDPPEVEIDQFRTLLDVDMRSDLPKYFNTFANPNLELDSIKDVVAFNLKNDTLHAPYGQEIFLGILEEDRSQVEFEPQKKELMQSASTYFHKIIEKHDLDALLSIDNNSARNAAAAHFPALGVPMGYTINGLPKNLTFIAPPQQEQLLLELGAAFERLSKSRKPPVLFQ
jgi:amidase